eukprot:scaffold2088_cov99-Isochrysis_galbana.AAC.1
MGPAPAGRCPTPRPSGRRRARIASPCPTETPQMSARPQERRRGTGRASSAAAWRTRPPAWPGTTALWPAPPTPRATPAPPPATRSSARPRLCRAAPQRTGRRRIQRPWRARALAEEPARCTRPSRRGSPASPESPARAPWSSRAWSGSRGAARSG